MIFVLSYVELICGTAAERERVSMRDDEFRANFEFNSDQIKVTVDVDSARRRMAQ